MSTVSPIDSQAIRRRVNREYIVLYGPPQLDADATKRLLDGVMDREPESDVVIDLRDVTICAHDAFAELDRQAQALNDAGSSLTLSHPSSVVEAALQELDGERSFLVRRDRKRRALRTSMRGMV